MSAVALDMVVKVWEVEPPCNAFNAPANIRVPFAGFLTDPERFLQQLDIAVDGIPEVVTHGESGLLIPPESPHRPAEALTPPCRHPVQRETLGRNARQAIVQRFAVATIAALFESLLEQRVLSRGRYK